MNTPELQRLKMTWLAAKEVGDTQTQLSLLHDLRDKPTEQVALIDFIAAYSAMSGEGEEDTTLLPLTQRALQRAIDRVFTKQVAVANLTELRKSRNLHKLAVAQGLRLTVDVWDKFEAGAIELVSLSQHQLARLAQFFQVSGEQFSTLLGTSQPTVTLNRRQTGDAACTEQQGLRKQSFAQAIARSSMSQEDKRFWLEQ